MTTTPSTATGAPTPSPTSYALSRHVPDMASGFTIVTAYGELLIERGPTAEREGWTKDLSDAIRQATNAQLVQQAVQQQCSNSLQNAAETVEMLRNPDDNGIDRANDMMRKAMGRTALVDDLKKLAELAQQTQEGGAA